MDHVRGAARPRLILGLLAAVLVVVAAIGLSRGAQGASETPEARAAAVASTLRCPTCQGLSVQDSTAPMAGSMRDVIAEQIAQGRTDEQIRAYFVDRYTDWVLLTPPVHSGGWLIWVVPVLLVIGGVAVVLAMAGRFRLPRGAGWGVVVTGLALVVGLALQANTGDRQAGGLLTGSVPEQGAARPPAVDDGGPDGAETDEILGKMEEQVALDPTHPGPRLALAAEAFTRGRADIVRSQSEAVLERDPAHVDALMLRALASEGPDDVTGRRAAERYLEVAGPEHPGRAAVAALLEELDRVG